MRLLRFFLVLAALAAAGCHQAGDALPHGAAWSNCHIGGLAERVRCLSFTAPLDWSDPDGSELLLTAVHVPAHSGRPEADPLFVLAGGPGQAGSDLGPWVRSAFAEVRRERDIVLVDQRGTGRSNPLDCDIAAASFAAIDLPAIRSAVAQCAANQEHDPRFFTSAEIVKDLERLREILDADRVSLWGGSFGTRIAQHYTRSYPERVRAVVLDAALPVGQSLFETAPASSQSAWDALVARCRDDRACVAAFPTTGSTFDNLLARLEDGAFDVRFADPATGSARQVSINRDLLSETVRGALYVPANAAMLPRAIERAAANDFGPLAAISEATAAWAGDTMHLGATLSVLCSEEVPRQDGAAAAQAAGNAFVGDAYYRFWRAACNAWPTRVLSGSWHAPLTADVPALVLSGGTDPVTPAALGRATASQFTPATHAVAAHGGHTISALGCAPRLIARFLASPLQELDTQCLDTSIAPVPFTLGPLGPYAAEVTQ